MAQTIFERFGGFASVRRVVSAFYDSALESEILSPYFEDVDMRRLLDHQTRFISAMMGGPGSYTDAHLERVHARLGITRAAFEEMAKLLGYALEDHDMGAADVKAVLKEITTRERLIVTRP